MQVEVEPLLDENSQHTDGRAPQAERVLGASRLLADGEDARQRVELVGDCEGHPRAGCGQLVAGAARQIVFADARGNLGSLAIGERVVRAHDSLQLGKLPDHRREQIAFAELRGAFRCGAIAVARSGDLTRERAHTARLVAERAELRLEGYGIECFPTRGQRLLAILIPEKRRIREARPYHTLISLAHLRRVAALDVAHRDEARQQPAS